MKMYYVYILVCRDNSFYIGYTADLKKRILEHNTGQGSFYIKSKLPVKLVCYEKYFNEQEARNRERQLKGWTRKKKIELIKRFQQHYFKQK
jgi:putative endonuclease